MYLYNITMQIPTPMKAAWLLWLREEYISELMKTGYFLSNKVLQLINLPDDEMSTYALQLSMLNKADIEEFEQNFATRFNQLAYEKWGESMVSFTSVLEEIG